MRIGKILERQRSVSEIHCLFEYNTIIGGEIEAMLRIRSIFNLLIVCIIFLPGCIEEKSKDVDNKIAKLEHKVKLLENNYDDLWSRTFDLELKQDRYDTCCLDPTDKSYQRIDTNLGFFLIACEDVKKHIDGYKLLINIGNPLYLKYNGFKLKVTWGKKYISKEITYEKWKESLREKELNYTDIIYPGAWNKVEMIISPAKPNEIGYLNLSIQVNNVGLYQRN
jgi:hypothetical protein